MDFHKFNRHIPLIFALCALAILLLSCSELANNNAEISPESYKTDLLIFANTLNHEETTDINKGVSIISSPDGTGIINVENKGEFIFTIYNENKEPVIGKVIEFKLNENNYINLHIYDPEEDYETIIINGNINDIFQSKQLSTSTS